MNYLKINGQTFDAAVAITEYERSFEVLDGDAAERVLSGRMQRDIIGTFLGRRVTIKRRGSNYVGINQVWQYLVQHSVDDSVMLEAADGNEVINMEVYYTSARQKLDFELDGHQYWGDIEITFVPMEPQLTPE